MLNIDLQVLNLDLEQFLSFGLFSNTDQTDITIGPLFVTKANCITPGLENDPNALYLVEAVDTRWLARRIPVNVQFNIRDGNNAYYYDSINGQDVNNVIPWTWDSAIKFLWEINNKLGPYPGMPLDELGNIYVPDGVPENYQFIGVDSYNALNVLLAKINCSLQYDPILDIFDIILLGIIDTDLDNLYILNNNHLIYSSDPFETTRTKLTSNVRVYFNKKHKYYGQEVTTSNNPQWITNNYIYYDVPNPLDVVTEEASTQIFWDDLSAIEDNAGNILNLVNLQERAKQVAFNYYTTTYYSTQRLLKRFDGPISDFIPSSQIRCVTWYINDTGIVTEITTSVEGIYDQVQYVDFYKDLVTMENLQPPDFSRITFPNYFPQIQVLDIDCIPNIQQLVRNLSTNPSQNVTHDLSTQPSIENTGEELTSTTLNTEQSTIINSYASIQNSNTNMCQGQTPVNQQGSYFYLGTVESLNPDTVKLEYRDLCYIYKTPNDGADIKGKFFGKICGQVTINGNTLPLYIILDLSATNKQNAIVFALSITPAFSFTQYNLYPGKLLTSIANKDTGVTETPGNIIYIKLQSSRKPEINLRYIGIQITIFNNVPVYEVTPEFERIVNLKIQYPISVNPIISPYPIPFTDSIPTTQYTNSPPSITTIPLTSTTAQDQYDLNTPQYSLNTLPSTPTTPPANLDNIPLLQFGVDAISIIPNVNMVPQLPPGNKQFGVSSVNGITIFKGQKFTGVQLPVNGNIPTTSNSNVYSYGGNGPGNFSANSNNITQLKQLIFNTYDINGNYIRVQTINNIVTEGYLRFFSLNSPDFLDCIITGGSISGNLLTLSISVQNISIATIFSGNIGVEFSPAPVIGTNNVNPFVGIYNDGTPVGALIVNPYLSSQNGTYVLTGNLLYGRVKDLVYHAISFIVDYDSDVNYNLQKAENCYVKVLSNNYSYTSIINSFMNYPINVDFMGKFTGFMTLTNTYIGPGSVTFPTYYITYNPLTVKDSDNNTIVNPTGVINFNNSNFTVFDTGDNVAFISGLQIQINPPGYSLSTPSLTNGSNLCNTKLINVVTVPGSNTLNDYLEAVNNTQANRIDLIYHQNLPTLPIILPDIIGTAPIFVDNSVANTFNISFRPDFPQCAVLLGNDTDPISSVGPGLAFTVLNTLGDGVCPEWTTDPIVLNLQVGFDGETAGTVIFCNFFGNSSIFQSSDFQDNDINYVWPDTAPDFSMNTTKIKLLAATTLNDDGSFQLDWVDECCLSFMFPNLRLAQDVSGMGPLTTPIQVTVTGLQGVPLLDVKPSKGNILYFDGTFWIPADIEIPLSRVSGYSSNQQQILGHNNTGVLMWYNITTCTT